MSEAKVNCQTCKAVNAETARFCSRCGAVMREQGQAHPAAQEDEVTRQQSRRSAGEATLVDRGRDSVLGSTIAGRYRIDAKLGAGGMGTVYRARRLLIGDEVAVKILHSEQSDPRAAERFRREAQAAARLKHPNAVTIHDFGVTDDGRQYLVMELVEGESLRWIIQQQGPVTPSTAAEIMNQVCAALDEAHRHHVLHRDLKPDNIVISVTDAGVRVKVLDFGIAKLRDDTAGNLTQTGSILGTPHYMSPEQCLGEELDTRSDIYSLGVVLYEMLTGLVPFNSPTPAAVVVQQVTQQPPSLRALNASVPAAIEAVVLRALEKQRAARPQTAGEFARGLSASIEKVMLPSPPSASGPAVGGLFGQPASQTDATVVVSRLSADRAFASPPGQVAQSRSRNSPLLYIAVGLGVLILVGIIFLLLQSRDEKRAPSEALGQLGNTASTRSTEQPQAQTPQRQITSSSNLKPEAVEKLVNRWVTAQNVKDFASYQSCYGVPFNGIKRTKTGRAYHYDLNAWMKDRWRMISAAAGLNIEVKNLRVIINGDSATVEFDQYYRSVRYSDWGPKILTVTLTPAGERIVYEELKASYPL